MIPDLSVLWVIGFVLLLAVVVQQLLFRPLLRVMQERHGAIARARELAGEAERKTSAASTEYEAQVAAAMREVDRQMDVARRAALDRRSELLAITREEGGELRAASLLQIRSATNTARDALSTEVESLSQVIADRVLERKVS